MASVPDTFNEKTPDLLIRTESDRYILLESKATTVPGALKKKYAEAH